MIYCLQEFVLKKLIAGRKVGRLGKAQVKMAVVVLYYTIVGSMSLISFTYFEVKSKASRDSLESLFLCESTGDLDCTDISLESITTLNALAVMVIVLVAFLPVVAVVFSFDPKICTRRNRKSLRISGKASSTIRSMS